MNNRIAFTSVMLVLSLISLPAVRAQDTAKPTAPSADPNAVRRDIYDLGLLHSILDVNLTEEQIKALTPLLKQIFEDDKARRQKDDDALRELAADIKKARADALDGTPIPKELEDRTAEMQKAATARLATAKRDAIEKILTVLWPTLSDTQKEAIEVQSRAFYGGRRVPAAYRANPAKAPKEEVQKLAVGGFIENVLLDDRTPVLMESLKPLKSETGGTKSGDNAAAAKP